MCRNGVKKLHLLELEIKKQQQFNVKITKKILAKLEDLEEQMLCAKLSDQSFFVHNIQR